MSKIKVKNATSLVVNSSPCDEDIWVSLTVRIHVQTKSDINSDKLLLHYPHLVTGVQLEFTSPSDFVAAFGAFMYDTKIVSIPASTEAPFHRPYPNGYCQD